MRQVFIKAITSVSLIVMLVGCSQGNQSRQVSPVIHQPTQGIAFDIANLHIFSAAGIHCTHHPLYPLDVDNRPGYPQGNLVLATTRTTYDIAELQQMKTYLATLFDLTDLPLKAPPDTLRWAPASAVGDDKAGLSHFGCYGVLEITNIGKTTIQIQSIDIRLTANSRRNTSQYRLIDDCSLLPAQVPCRSGGAGGGNPAFYHFQLSEGKIKKIFSPQLPTPPEITLNPTDTTEAYVVFDSAPDNLIYSIIPSLVLDTSSGPQMFSLTQLASTIYFADVSQFACYTLQGNKFVLLKEERNSSSYFCI